jgi:hypothetical protein
LLRGKQGDIKLVHATIKILGNRVIAFFVGDIHLCEKLETTGGALDTTLCDKVCQ